MSKSLHIPALALAASLATLTGCPATPVSPKPVTHKTAEPANPTPTKATNLTDTTPDAVKHAYFGKVVGADGKGVAGVSIKAYIVANNGGQLVTDNGSGLVTDNGSGVIANNAGNVLANNAGNVISNDGASSKARHLLAADPTTTDANGEFKLDIPEGQTFNVEAVQGDNSKAFAGQVTSKTSKLDMTLQPTGSIHGKVAYPDDPKVTDFTGVDVFIPGSSYVAKTAADGSFTISNVPVGSFSLYAVKRGLGGGHQDGVKVEAKGVAEVPQLALKLLPLKIKTLSVPSAAAGATITVEGDYLGAEQGLPFQVRLNGAVMEGASRDTSGKVSFTLPAKAASGDVVVDVDGHASNALHLDVIDDFSVLVPKSIEPGKAVKLSFQALDADKKPIKDPALKWATTSAGVTVDDQGNVKATTAGTAAITVTSGNLVLELKLTVAPKAIGALGGRTEPLLHALKDVAYDAANQRLVLACEGNVLAYTPATDATTLLAGAADALPDTETPVDKEGKGDQARFAGILGLALNPAGGAYVLESTAILALDPGNALKLVAGSLTEANAETVGGDEDLTSRDGAGQDAVLEMPTACGVTKAGKLYFIDNDSLRTLEGDTVSTVSGTKGNVDASGALVVDNGDVPWVAGALELASFGASKQTIAFKGGGGKLDNLITVGGAAADAAGNFFISADGFLFSVKPDGTRTILAGADADAGSDADGVGSNARFASPGRLAFGPDGVLYLAEETALRKITFTDPLHPTVTTVLQGAGSLKRQHAVKK
jgi:hypothetical protein